jgi:LPS-assembly lipoprotein
MARPEAPRRRALLAALAAMGGLAGGCGFQLRRTPTLNFRRIALTGFAPAAPIGLALRRQIDATPDTRVVQAVNQAEVVFEAIRDERGRGVVASTAAGQVREMQLRQRLRFRLVTPAGREVIPPSELLLTRDLSYDETLALAKEQEEAEMFRAMQADIVAQVMRRLAAVPPL